MKPILYFSILVFAAAALSGDTLSDNTTASSGGTNVASGKTVLAAKFFAPTAATLSSVALTMSATGNAAAVVSIYSDSNGRPGSLLGTLIPPATYSSALALNTFTSTAGVALSAGNFYYVVMAATSGSLAWSWTPTNTGSGAGFQAAWAYSLDSGSLWRTQSSFPLQMQVSTGGGTVNPGCSYSLSANVASSPIGGGLNSVAIGTSTQDCSWTTSSNVLWIAITSGTSGTGNGAVAYSVDANLTGSPRSGTLTVGGQPLTITQDGPNSGPSVVSVSGIFPSVASGTTQSFTFNFSDTAGAASLSVVNILVNNSLDGRAACYIAYSVPTSTVYLVSDAGNGTYSGTLTLPGSASLSNSQCTIQAAGSSALLSGNTLALTLSITFNPNFAGNRVIYLAARDAGVNNTGWKTMGVYGVTPLPTTFPRPVSATPSSGFAQSATVTYTYTDATAATNLQTVWALMNTALDGRGACYVAYYRPGALLFLVPDNGDGTQATNIALGGGGALSNSQCSISSAGSSAVVNGAQLTLNLAVTYLSGPFSGPKGVWMAVQTTAGATSPWQAQGVWQVP